MLGLFPTPFLLSSGFPKRQRCTSGDSVALFVSERLPIPTCTGTTRSGSQARAIATKPTLVEVTAGGLITNAGRCELSAHAANAIREAAASAGGLGCKAADVDVLRVVDWSGVAEGVLPGDIGAMLIYAGDDSRVRWPDSWTAGFLPPDFK